MHKLLVLNPDNVREIIEVDEGGGYFDPARVLWDERVSGPMPEEHLAAEAARLAAIKAQEAMLEYREKRRAEYPALGDQMDALFKARLGDSSELAVIDQKIAEVKAKYPKPSN